MSTLQREARALSGASPRRLRGGAVRPLQAGKRAAGSGTGSLAGFAGTWGTFTPTGEKTYMGSRWRQRRTRTVRSRRAAPGARQGAPLSTSVPSEAGRETSQVKHSSAEVQVEVKGRY